ncbi:MULTISPECIES: hypothetical protein [Flammeovirga]|uniref:Lipocalin-like domain-containing protein n=1 Tax=Flammeovirga agarivorans TaxID=2726742 RepID=A0A7X8SNP1_9BACT|nr:MULTISPECIES: hypothetical protein [Flammeovirga]NLR93569.1 hypothetical protein [Flammeovirga agarivorans]
MRKGSIYILLLLSIFSCIEVDQQPNIQGTWELISAVTIKEDTVEHLEMDGIRMIKIINQNHFAFLNHDEHKGIDSTKAKFIAGGGAYTLKGNQYKENLEYCTHRAFEGYDFDFTVTIKGDTLTQEGYEIVEEKDIHQKIIEKYVKVQGGKAKNIYAFPLM